MDFFSFIVRHPVSRINSLINHYVLQVENNSIHYSKLSGQIPFNKQEIYKFYEKITKKYSVEQTGVSDFKIICPDNDISQPYAVNLIKTFFDFALSFISFDLECIENCKK